MENKEQKEYRNLKASNFETQLLNLINSSGLDYATGYYILRDVARQIEIAYNKTVDNEYEQFCKDNTKDEENEIKDKEE